MTALSVSKSKLGESGKGGDVTDPKDDTMALLDANEAFYRAFASADVEAMEDLWGRDGPIAVQHPGGPRLVGRATVLKSWRMILRAPPDISCTVEDVIEDEEHSAVICQEDLGRVVVRMVNVFHLEKDRWKMIYHGPAPKRVLSS